MEQEIFNQFMENAIVHLQEKGLLPKQPSQAQQQDQEPSQEDITRMLQDRGLLPRK